MQSPVVRAEARIPADEVIQTCVAIGWADEKFPANGVVSRRTGGRGGGCVLWA